MTIIDRIGPAWRVLTRRTTESAALLEIGQGRLSRLADDLTRRTGDTLLAIHEDLREALAAHRAVSAGLHDDIVGLSEALSELSARVTALEQRQTSAAATRERIVTEIAEIRALIERAHPEVRDDLT